MRHCLTWRRKLSCLSPRSHILCRNVIIFFIIWLSFSKCVSSPKQPYLSLAPIIVCKLNSGGKFLDNAEQWNSNVHSVQADIITASDLKSRLNYKYLTNEVDSSHTRLAASYPSCQTRPLSSSLQSGRLTDSQPAESACSPRRAFHPAASALLPPHTHPSCLVGLSNPASPSPLLSFFSIIPPPPVSPSLPPLHWACEGEPVPSGTTVQIATLPLQMEAALLWITM